MNNRIIAVLSHCVPGADYGEQGNRNDFLVPEILKGINETLASRT